MTISRRAFVKTSALAAVSPRLSPLAARLSPLAARRSFDPWLEIDASALANNARAVAKRAGGKPILAVAKNNAYGCGLAVAGPIFDSLPAVDALAVVRPDEALALRKAGVRKPILLMGPASDDEAEELARRNVRLAPYAEPHAKQLVQLARRLGRPVAVHLYVDTGMHRMGMPHDRVLGWLEDASLRRALRIEGAFTELTEDQEFDREQAARLGSIADRARAGGLTLGRLHAASSDALMQDNAPTFLDAVRVGLAMYGGCASDDMSKCADLRVAYRLKARVIRLDHLAAGDGISYHRRYQAKTPTWTATLAVGHVDGYPTGAVKGCEVSIGGRLYPVVGTVSASHTVVALGEPTSVQVGDEATLVGPDNPALHPNEVAKRSAWSEYNMFMHLNAGLRRVVV
jgi:alanine racemase